MNEKKLCIITIADSITATSMPINEFVIYRAKSGDNIRQSLIVCSEEEYNGVEIPSTVAVHFVGSSVSKTREVIKNEIRKCQSNDEFFVFHMHGQKSSLVFMRASLFLGVRERTMFTIHSLCSVRSLKYRLSSYICALFANYVTCVSNAVLNDYPRWIKCMKGKRICAVVNGIDFVHLEQIVKTLPEHYSVCDINRLICVDRIIPLKNQAFLVKVLKHLPMSRLVIVGSQDKSGYLDDVIREAGVKDRIEYTGLVKRDKVYEELNRSGIYVSASTIEGLHNSVLEAMGIGTIPVVSAIPAHSEIANKVGGGIFTPIQRKIMG